MGRAAANKLNLFTHADGLELPLATDDILNWGSLRNSEAPSSIDDLRGLWRASYFTLS